MSGKTRSLETIVAEVCSEQGIECTPLSYGWILELQKGARTGRIIGYRFDINTSASADICADKCAASAVLARHGIPRVQHTLFMAPNDERYVGEGGNWALLTALLHTHGALVCKANEGSGGRNVFKADTQFALEKAAHTIFKTSRTMAVAPYLEIEDEYRVVVLNGAARLVFAKQIRHITGDGRSTVQQLIAGMAQTGDRETLQTLEFTPEQLYAVPAQGETIKLHWKHNLGQGAEPQPVTDAVLMKALADLAVRAAAAVGIAFASVDIVSAKGERMVLEVNSGIMLERFAKMNDDNYKRVKAIYRDAILTMLGQTP